MNWKTAENTFRWTDFISEPKACGRPQRRYANMAVQL